MGEAPDVEGEFFLVERGGVGFDAAGDLPAAVGDEGDDVGGGVAFPDEFGVVGPVDVFGEAGAEDAAGEEDAVAGGMDPDLLAAAFCEFNGYLVPTGLDDAGAGVRAFPR